MLRKFSRDIKDWSEAISLPVFLDTHSAVLTTLFSEETPVVIFQNNIEQERAKLQKFSFINGFLEVKTFSNETKKIHKDAKGVRISLPVYN